MLCISVAPKVIDENSWCVYTGLESSVLQMGAKDHLLSFGLWVQILIPPPSSAMPGDCLSFSVYKMRMTVLLGVV